MKTSPDLTPEIAILHRTRVAGLDVTTLAVDGTSYCVVPTARGFAVTKHDADGGSEEYAVPCRDREPLGCTCGDRKYRNRPRGCRHMHEIRFVLNLPVEKVHETQSL